MFLAKKENGTWINLLEEEGQKGDKYYCPHCQSPLLYKMGKIKRPHFAHQQKKACLTEGLNESSQHLDIKASLYRWARQSHHAALEVYFPEEEQMADLLLDGKIVLEVQCSSLSTKRLAERSRAYSKAGFPCIWLLGRDLFLKERMTKLQRAFLSFSPSLGFYVWQVDLDRQCLQLNYLIHEDLKGQIYYQTKIFPFGEGDLVDCLRYPFQERSVQSFAVQTDQNLMAYIRKQLYYRNPRWMKEQEGLYLMGQHLLDYSWQDFYPHVLPVRIAENVQIEADIQSYYDDFYAYYETCPSKKLQVLYSPFYYQHLARSPH